MLKWIFSLPRRLLRLVKSRRDPSKTVSVDRTIVTLTSNILILDHDGRRFAIPLTRRNPLSIYKVFPN